MNQTEQQIVAFLRDEALEGSDSAMSLRTSTWRSFLWAIFHPRRFREEYGRFFALTLAADAIETGSYKLEGSDGRA